MGRRSKPTSDRILPSRWLDLWRDHGWHQQNRGAVDDRNWSGACRLHNGLPRYRRGMDTVMPLPVTVFFARPIASDQRLVMGAALLVYLDEIRFRYKFGSQPSPDAMTRRPRRRSARRRSIRTTPAPAGANAGQLLHKRYRQGAETRRRRLRRQRQRYRGCRRIRVAARHV